jgi:hypothetical protein
MSLRRRALIVVMVGASGCGMFFHGDGGEEGAASGPTVTTGSAASGSGGGAGATSASGGEEATSVGSGESATTGAGGGTSCVSAPKSSMELAIGVKEPGRLALDKDHVLWTVSDGEDSRVVRVSKDGGDNTVLYQGIELAGVFDITLGGELYYVTLRDPMQSRVRRGQKVPTDPSVTTQLWAGPGLAHSIVFSGYNPGRLFFSLSDDPGSIVKKVLNESDQSLVSGLKSPTALAFHAQDELLCWGAQASIGCLTVGGPNAAGSHGLPGTPIALAVPPGESSALYWAEQGSHRIVAGTVGLQGVDVAVTQQPLHTDSAPPTAMAVDESHVYWTAGGWVRRIGRTGEGCETIGVVGHGAAIAVDATWVFVSDTLGGILYRFAK